MSYSEENVTRFIAHTMAMIQQSSTKEVQTQLLVRDGVCNENWTGEGYAVHHLISNKLRTPPRFPSCGRSTNNRMFT